MKTHPTAQAHQVGFTLVEAVIALLLLGIVSVVVIKLNGQLFSNANNLSTWQSDAQLLQACVDRVIGLRKNGKAFSDFTAGATDTNCYGLNSRVTVKVSTLTCPTPTATPASGAQCKQLDIQASGIGTPVTLLIANY